MGFIVLLSPVICILVGVASGPSPAHDLDALATGIRAGERLVVATIDGRSLTGRSVSVSGAGLVLDVESRSVTFEAADLKTVSAKRSGWKRGAVVGSAAGACLYGLLAIALDDGPSLGDGVRGSLAGGAAWGTVGAVLGSVVRANRVVYRTSTPEESGRAPRAAVAPIVVPGRAYGGAVNVTW